MNCRFSSFLGNFFNRIQYFFPPLFDQLFVQLKYSTLLGKTIDWQYPQTYTEKLNIFKISSRSEKLWPYVDKYTVRNWVSKKIGKKYLVPLIGVYDQPAEINFNQLPRQFVIKANHGSGWLIICQDKNKLNWPKANKKLALWLKTNYYRLHKERQYKLIKPKIIIENFLTDQNNQLPDYKFFCFNGQVKFIQVDIDRFTNHKRSFFSLGWKKLPFTWKYPPIIQPIPRPKNLNKMIQIVAKLANGFPHIRVDLYNLNGKIYFGEMTFTPESGLARFYPNKYDLILGKYFKLEPEDKI